MGKNETKILSSKHQYPVRHQRLYEKIKQIDGVLEVYPCRYFPKKSKKPVIKIKGFESKTNSYVTDIIIGNFCQKYLIKVEEENRNLERKIMSVTEYI